MSKPSRVERLVRVYRRVTNDMVDPADPRYVLIAEEMAEMARAKTFDDAFGVICWWDFDEEELRKTARALWRGVRRVGP